MNGFLEGFVKAFKALMADPPARSTLIMAVILYSFFYPVAYQHQVASDLPVVVVDLDRSPMSRTLLRKVDAVRAVVRVDALSSLAQARAAIAHGRAEGILVIEPDFERDIRRGGQGKVTLLAEAAFLVRGSYALQGLAEAVAGFTRDAVFVQAQFAGMPAASPVNVIQRPLFNTREGYGSSVVAGVSVLIIQQTLIMGIVLLAGTRREMKGRIALPAPVLTGVLAAFWSIGMLGLLYFAGFVFWFQDYPRGGNLPGLLLFAALFAAAVVGLAAFIGSFFRVRERALQIILVVSTPLYFISGLSWPQTAMPDWFVWLTRLVPTTPGINAMIQFHEMGATIGEVFPELLNLLVLVLLYGALAYWRFRPEVRPNQGQVANARIGALRRWWQRMFPE